MGTIKVRERCCKDWFMTVMLGIYNLCHFHNSIKIKGNQFDNFVVIGGIASCRYDNLQCLRWWQCCQIDDILFSVNGLTNRWSNMRTQNNDLVLYPTALFFTDGFITILGSTNYFIHDIVINDWFRVTTAKDRKK